MNENKCPICEGIAVQNCKCFLRHSVCSEKHEWHHCPVHGTVIVGPADHSSGMGMSCICVKKEYDGIRGETVSEIPKN